MKKLKISLILLVFAVFCGLFYFLVFPPKIINTSINSEIVIDFDKPVKRQMLEHIITLEVHGEWRYENPLVENHLYRTLRFVPAIGFQSDTQYEIELKNIINPIGIGISNYSFFSFKTEKNPEENNPEPKQSEPNITLIDIPIDWQDYPLSCEAASLKMALASKKVFVSEDQIMKKIGYDLTPRKNNVWGDPYKSYVGDISGKICSTGFGVFWEPVAQAAGCWRPSQAFTNWTIEELISELNQGNSAVVWGTLPVASLTDCSWHTPEGKYIKAYKQTHVRLAVGFIGSVENPSKIILNDPLSGKLYWSTDYFISNWQSFNSSAVVVR